ncbi:Hypothetical_protein [Hexamita inflata]|uniref:Hypothetical_protein n=1 Tax=Hexamita inflata TaxID=28002 RepID=A0AA86PFY1_9EUKA|nr:Hypothetical protein HINF_LOCUS26134 [Hexamita inflata]
MVNCSIVNSKIQTTGQYAAGFLANAVGNTQIYNNWAKNISVIANQFAGGFVSYIDSLMTCQNSMTTNVSVTSANNYAGVFGVVNSYANVVITNNLMNQLTVVTVSNFAGFVAVLNTYANIVIQTSQLNNSRIQCSNYGGFIGYVYAQGVAMISESNVIKTAIQGTYVGGFIGYFSGVNSNLLSCRVSNVTLTGSNVQFGTGYRTTALNTQNSVSDGSNLINSVLQNNCNNFATSC